MFSLTTREQTLLIVVFTATLLGAAVKHWRDVRRERAAEVAAATVAPAKPTAAKRSGTRSAPPKPAPADDIALAAESADR